MMILMMFDGDDDDSIDDIHVIISYYILLNITNGDKLPGNANFVNGIGSNVLIFLHPNVTDIMFNMFRFSNKYVNIYIYRERERDGCHGPYVQALSHSLSLATARSLVPLPLSPFWGFTCMISSSERGGGREKNSPDRILVEKKKCSPHRVSLLSLSPSCSLAL
jgi:hypothetical protein